VAKTRDALSVQQGSARKGLQVRRRFTTEGVHPYDELTWERRDAVITNWRDGSTAFEQRDLEFPSTWSQNATNIVAQKYFRGPLGTPQREHSVRQMVDRVAGTITTWGVKDGYFANQADAEAFRAELTRLLVNQEAAFNSPVWFNVGVEPHPQCSACQPYDALISTPNGMVRIGDLVERRAVGTVVYDAHGETRVRAVKFNGDKRVYRVRLRNGSFVEATGDHLVFAVPERRSQGSWLRVDQLEPGMRLHLYPHRASSEDLVRGLAVSLERQREEGGGVATLTRTASGTTEISEAALAGWLQADGFAGQYEAGTNTSLTIEFMTVTEEEHDWVQQHLQAVFPDVHQHVRTFQTADTGLVGRRVRLYGEALRPFVETWDLLARRHEMRVPSRLWTASNEAVAAYLRSVFQADGYVTVQGGSSRVTVGVIGERWTEDLQVLLLRLGIYARRLRKLEPRPDRSDLHEVQINLRSERIRFAEKIGFVSADKSARLAASLDLDGKDCPDLREEEILAIEDRGVQPVYDIQTDSGEYLSNNVRVHNCFILSVEDTMPSILNWYVEEGLIFKGGSGAGINLSTIRSSREPLGNGGEASGPVSFMRGADSSAGTIKCLHHDTEIATESGLLRIADVRPGTRVATRHGPKRVVAVHDNGVRPLVKVRTALGDEILCTPEHRFRVRGADGETWREAQDLRPDDHVVIDLANTGYGSLQPLTPVGPGHHNEREHELPTVLDEAFALWLGWIYGDGSITTRRSANFIALQLGDEDPELPARYTALTRTLFGPSAHIYTDRHVDKPDASASVRFSSTQVIRFLEANGLRKGRAADLRIPELIKSSPPAVRAAFLSGVFEADGHVGNGYPTLSTISADFARDVHRLLLSIGIPSKIGVIDDRTNAHGRNPVHTVRVLGCEGVRRFAKLVGFVSERKSRALEAAVIRKDQSPYETAWVLPHVGAELDGVWRTSGSALKRALAPYARYSVPRAMSLLRARALLERYPEELATSSLARFALGHEIYVPVTVEPAGEGPTFDLTVEDVHEYLVHNIVTHNSGGKTRRAAKMVVLNVDHPDVRDFIWCKAREEHKARVLRDAGFDMDLDGRDSISIQYQNANNSVRVTDEFMHAYDSDGKFDLKAVLDGHVIEETRARELMREIAQAAWECADPGMQYDTTINDWHTTPESGRINASNPCFTGETLVHTDKGLIRFDELARRAVEGETFGIYTHDATNSDAPSETVTLSRHEAVMVTGVNPVVRLTFSNGAQVRCTPHHRFWTANRGWVAARDLEPTDEVRLLDHSTPADAAERRLPVPTEVAAYASKGDHSAPMALPEKWDPDFAHLLGWLVGDGSFSGDVISAIYGSAEDREAILPRHQRLFSKLNGGREPKLSVQANGTVQLRLSRRALALFFEALGLKRVKAAEKDVPWSIFQAPTDIVCAFLRGLFDADGTVVNQEANATRYVGLGSRSMGLLRSVQALLSSLGITSRIYTNGKGGPSGFTYTGRDGVERSYSSAIGHDLRIAGADADRFAAMVGFELPSKAARLTTIADAAKYQKARVAKLMSREDDGFEVTYNLSEPKNHSYIVQGMIVANCSEYMHLDNSACNLASLNLLKFLKDDGVFDVESFKHAVEIVFLAQEIIVGNSSYPTEKITRNAKDYRQLGLGYANLGALLMALGQPYDSDGGRAWAGAITALMTGHAYRTSARVAQVTGPFAGYPKNREPMLRVIRKHRKAVDDIDAKLVQPSLLDAARTAWDEALKFGEEHGFRNAQASVIAPTGCLTPDTLVTTDRGLVRLGELGDRQGAQWQDLNLTVSTDDGPRRATKFFINGEEPTRRIVTKSGYNIQGTLRHRIKVVDLDTGAWVWRKLADIRPDDVVPLQLGTMIGDPRRVPLPVLDEAYWTGERGVRVPDHVSADLAELVGYFMGDGSLHAKGLRFCVADTDLDVVERLQLLGKELFGIEAVVSPQVGYHEVALHSVRLARWWQASGFSKHLPGEEHSGKGWEPHVPSAILETNDREVYGAFLRGLFEADGSVAGGVPSLSTASERFADELRGLLLVLGIPSTTRVTTSGRGMKPISQVRVRNLDFVPSFTAIVGLISARKSRACGETVSVQSGNRDRIHLPRDVWNHLVPIGHPRRNAVQLSVRRRGGVSRKLAVEIAEETGDPRLQEALGYVFERVAVNEDGGIQQTYDLSVPDNVTYIAAGFVSHNTIGLLMDCDTTGIEPDLALVKTKKLVGGGSMSIVNQTVPRALRRLGYAEEHVQAILEYIAEHNSVKGAPALRTEHYPVFDCAIGDSPIHYMGHIRMMAAVQPFISGALSKTVNMPESVTVEEVERAYYEGWKLGLKALAIYRDNCKVGQPLSATKSSKVVEKAEADGEAEAAGTEATAAAGSGKADRRVVTDTGAVIEVESAPVRRRLPRTRPSRTTSFRVGDIEGYMTAGSYPDDGLGEIFVKVSKQGSTLSGVMDAFAIAVSLGLQYGVPLEVYVAKFSNMIFEPNGITDDPDIRITQSLVDYIARRLAIDYLDVETRRALGIKTTAERIEEVNGSTAVTTDAAAPADQGDASTASGQKDTADATNGGGPVGGTGQAAGPEPQAVAAPTPRAELSFTPGMAAVDAPFCSTCGVRMRPAGSCFVCESCGTTSGCS
jgi:ribonucleoside-diphosphate reductase alpha chain